MIRVRRADDRGQMTNDWLQARYSFSFGEYRDSNHMSYGPLRVMNEDVVKPGGGFPMHGHANFEIVTYVIDGCLEHKDSMGNSGVIRAGDVQYMRAGKGVKHSEFNPLKEQETHLLQIWFKAKEKDVDPLYDIRKASDVNDGEPLDLLLSADGRKGSMQINQDVCFYKGRLEADEEIDFRPDKDRVQWVQIIKGGVTINDVSILAGDGAAIENEETFRILAKEPTTFLLFDMKPNQNT